MALCGGQPTLGDSSTCWLNGLPAVDNHKKSFYGHEACMTRNKYI